MEENAYLHVDKETLKQIDEKMPPQEELLDLAEFFKVFGDGTRLKILYVLLAAEMFSTGELGLFAIGVAVAFVLSGYFGLYSSQRILFSKIKRGPVEGEAHSA